MLIFDDQSNAVILDSIYTPTLTDYFWVLDLSMMDFTLTPLLVLEEIVCPSIVMRIKGFDFILPANWNMLVYAEETQEMDVVEIGNLAGREFTSLIYGSEKTRHEPGIVTVIDYRPSFKNIAPSLNKHQLLCHPIGPSEWINIAPTDTYNKFLKNKTVGNILS